MASPKKTVSKNSKSISKKAGAKKSPKNLNTKRKPSAAKASKPKLLWRAVFLAALAVILGVSLIFESQINGMLGLTALHEAGEFDGNSTAEVINIASDGSLTVHFVDVGQGDACIIELPDDKLMLIDAGKDKEKTKLLDYIDSTINKNNELANKKQEQGFGFDYAILTHADEDHCGGFDDVLQTYAARVFYRPNELASYNGFTDPGRSFLKTGYTSQSTLAYKKAIDLGYKNSESVRVTGVNEEEMVIRSELEKNNPEYYEFVFYTPIANTYKDRNDYSPVMILYYQNRTIVMSGDAEAKAEAEFVTAATEGAGKFEVFKNGFSADVIKLGHHGSRTSSGEPYLNMLTNQELRSETLCVISVGFNNSYLHPHKEVLARLDNMGFASGNILRTDLNGTIVLAVKGGSIYHGADLVLEPRAAIAVGVVEVTWREICITLWVTAALVLIIQPLSRKKSR